MGGCFYQENSSNSANREERGPARVKAALVSVLVNDGDDTGSLKEEKKSRSCQLSELLC